VPSSALFMADSLPLGKLTERHDGLKMQSAWKRGVLALAPWAA
jgi:hypothetical protein